MGLQCRCLILLWAKYPSRVELFLTLQLFNSQEPPTAYSTYSPAIPHANRRFKHLPLPRLYHSRFEKPAPRQVTTMSSASTLEVARRSVVAVDHPMVIKNLDNAIKTFGLGAEVTGRPFSMVS